MKEQLEDEIRKVEENGKNALAEHKKSIDRTLNNHEKKLAEIKSQGTSWRLELQKKIESFRIEIQAQMRKEMEAFKTECMAACMAKCKEELHIEEGDVTKHEELAQEIAELKNTNEQLKRELEEAKKAIATGATTLKQEVEATTTKWAEIAKKDIDEKWTHVVAKQKTIIPPQEAIMTTTLEENK